MVTEINNNKFYHMSDLEDGTFLAKWGRVGVTETSKVYPISKWNSTYNKKVNKGYTDVTHLRKVTSDKKFKDINDPSINSFLSSLQSYSNKSLSNNYTVSSQEVTIQQIDTAQTLLNDLTNLTESESKFNRKSADDYLMELYKTIPRKMSNVKSYLLNDNSNIETLIKIIQREQESVDNMAQSVSAQMAMNNSDVEITLAEALGISISNVTNEEIDMIKNLLKENSNQFVRAFRVDNFKTKELFEIQKTKSFKPDTTLLWHGSRNENWLSILNKGLMIRPTGVVLTGAMFGNGCYFANKAQKSIGYTSLMGSYWVKGGDSKAYLALYEVNTGVSYDAKIRESWMGSLNESKIRDKKCDSLHAKAGRDLRNDEIIVYNQNQSTIKYVVEIKK